MKTETKALRRAALMPPLCHTLPGETFAWGKSEVAQWLVQQPELLDALFTFCNHGGAIVFDKASGKWRGKDYGSIDTSLPAQQ
jgi:hypothetical protein